MNDLLVSARGVEKSYGAMKAIRSADFELRRGEVMALLGENGTGKSTLVKIISGLVQPDAGTVEIDGSVADLSSPTRARQAGVAVVNQELSLVPALSAAENVFLGSALTGSWTQRRLHALAEPYLDEVGLDRRDRRRPVAELSIAERQLIEIARVLSRDAKVLIFDEPTAALADQEIARVITVIKGLVAQGRGVIYVTHRLGEVFELADRVTVMRDGSAMAPVSTQDIDVDGIVEAMLGRTIDTMFPERAASFGAPRLRLDALEVGAMRDPFSLEVRAGEIVGFAGQLGSGAPQILRAIAGAEPVFGGTVHVDDSPLKGGGIAGAMKAGVAFCSEDRKRDGIFADRSVETNLWAPAITAVTPQGFLSNRKASALAERLATMFQVPDNKLPVGAGTLSGGNQQKVALGKWMGIHPKVLLIEEPTRGVDVGARAEIYRHLRALAEEGLAIVFASSDLPEVAGLSDTVVTFYRGRAVRSAPAAELTEEGLMFDVTHGPVTAAAS